MTAQKTETGQWAGRLVADLAGSDDAAKTLVAGLTEEQLNWAPVAGIWSVGQCVEHLCATNEAYATAITAALQNRPDAPVAQITPGWFGRWFLRSFGTPSEKSKKAKAPPKIRPGSHVKLTVLERFLASNEACRALIVQARSKDVNRIRFWNPFVPGIRFTVGTALEIIAGHERRHLLQAQRVLESEGFPK